MRTVNRRDYLLSLSLRSSLEPLGGSRVYPIEGHNLKDSGHASTASPLADAGDFFRWGHRGSSPLQADSLAALRAFKVDLIGFIHGTSLTDELGAMTRHHPICR
jgi:hypothetical protein